MNWKLHRLADDRAEYGDNAGKQIIVTADGEQEITGVIHDDDHAALLVRAPELLAENERLRHALEKADQSMNVHNDGRGSCIWNFEKTLRICVAALAKNPE